MFLNFPILYAVAPLSGLNVGISLKELEGSDVEVFKSVLAENVSGRIVEEDVLSKI